MKNSICPIIQELERIYDILADKYGLGKLAKRPIITIQTKGSKKNTLGWYGANRWASGKKEINEINICAESLNKNPIETLIHEMVHYHNSCEKVKDCNAHQYHNKHFKERAENYGLNVEKDGRHGWAFTSVSPKLKKFLDTIKINKEVFNLYRQTQISIKAPTKLKKFTCGCTIIRCATELRAKCLKCNNEFTEE